MLNHEYSLRLSNKLVSNEIHKICDLAFTPLFLEANGSFFAAQSIQNLTFTVLNFGLRLF